MSQGPPSNLDGNHKTIIAWGFAIALVVLAVAFGAWVNIKQTGESAAKPITAFDNAISNNLMATSHSLTNFMFGFSQMCKALGWPIVLEPQISINSRVVHQGTWPIAEVALKEHRFAKSFQWQNSSFGSKKKLNLEATFVGKYGYDLKQSSLSVNITSNDTSVQSVNIDFPRVKLLSLEMQDLEATEENGWWNSISVQNRNILIAEFQEEARSEMEALIGPELEKEIRQSLTQFALKAFGLTDSSAVQFDTLRSPPPP